MFAAYFVRGPVDSLPEVGLNSNTLAILIVLTTVFLALATLSLASISRNRQITKQLRDSEERIKIATASGQIGIWDYDLQTNELVWDDTMFALYQARREDFSGSYDAWLTRLHPEDKEATEKALQDAIAGIKEYNAEFRVVFPDGDIGYIKGNAHVIRDQAGKVIRLIGTNWDNSDHAQTQQKLNFAFAGINKSRNAFFWINNLGQIVDINDCACESLGYGREELIGQYKWFFNPDFSAESWPAHWAEQKKTLTCTFESHHQRKDGAIFPVEITANYIVVDGKEYCFYFCHDITSRKLNEEQIRQLAFYDPLTQLPNRRLLQERLIHAIEMAKRDGKQLALLMLDLDRFKVVNDSLGHRMGDELLQQVAERMNAILRKVDTVARLGGDEFVVLLEDIIQPGNAAVVSKKIISGLATHSNFPKVTMCELAPVLVSGCVPNMGTMLKYYWIVQTPRCIAPKTRGAAALNIFPKTKRLPPVSALR
jgi:diguanylate cyclase (GGDEF)-like protein/PAS domain S-box-containing protein